jgi:DNA repair protein RadD
MTTELGLNKPSSAAQIELDAVEYFGEAKLRWYQIAARNELAWALKHGHKRIMIILPTGAGKTITIACSMSHKDVREALGVQGDRKMRVLFISHMHRLLSQAEQTFADSSNVELILQSVFSPISDDVIAQGWDVAIIEECHHECTQNCQYQLDALGNRPIIGMTATPDRPDGVLIKFDYVISSISREQAVAEGWLAETDLYTFVDAPSRDKTEIVSNILDMYHHQMGGTMIFMRTKKEVVAVYEHLKSMGFGDVSVPLLAQTATQLDEVLNDFSAGKTRFLINCKRIGEGVDVKGCDTVILGRNLGSYVLLQQYIGRAARPGSDCNVYELVNPLSATNLDVTVCVGTPRKHTLNFKHRGQWVSREFDYAS